MREGFWRFFSKPQQEKGQPKPPLSHRNQVLLHFLELEIGKQYFFNRKRQPELPFSNPSRGDWFLTS